MFFMMQLIILVLYKDNYFIPRKAIFFQRKTNVEKENMF